LPREKKVGLVRHPQPFNMKQNKFPPVYRIHVKNFLEFLKCNWRADYSFLPPHEWVFCFQNGLKEKHKSIAIKVASIFVLVRALSKLGLCSALTSCALI
jgi:hypothetical protein